MAQLNNISESKKSDSELRHDLWRAKWDSKTLPCEYFNSEDLEKMHDEMMDDTHPGIELAGCVYMPSDVLKSVDPICYQQSVSEYIDAEIGETLAWIVDEDIAIRLDDVQSFADWVLDQDKDIQDGFKSQKWSPELLEALGVQS